MLIRSLPSIGAARERLNEAIEVVSASLTTEDAEILRSAALRSLEAMRVLEDALAGQPHSERDLSQQTCPRLPKFEQQMAREFVLELNAVIAEIEHNILAPAEEQLSGDPLSRLRRLVGQVWGWIVCDLQDPIWRQYPDLAPPGPSAPTRMN